MGCRVIVCYTCYKVYGSCLREAHTIPVLGRNNRIGFRYSEDIVGTTMRIVFRTRVELAIEINHY